MRVVLDTNVLISATLIAGGNEDRILRAWRRGAFEESARYLPTSTKAPQ